MAITVGGEPVFVRSEDEKEPIVAAIQGEARTESISFSIDNRKAMQPLRVEAEGELVRLDGEWYAHFRRLQARVDTDIRESCAICYIKLGMFWHLKRQDASDFAPKFRREYINAGTLPVSAELGADTPFEKRNFWVRLPEKPYLQDPLPRRVTKINWVRLFCDDLQVY